MDYLQYSLWRLSWLHGRNSFKPYYKWITFNTYESFLALCCEKGVLNLIINGLPSIHKKCREFYKNIPRNVLNLIINGLPSIPKIQELIKEDLKGVLNLIINGLPSIHITKEYSFEITRKVLNLIINGLPSIRTVYTKATNIRTRF